MKKFLVAGACAASLVSSALAEGFFLGGEGACFIATAILKVKE